MAAYLVWIDSEEAKLFNLASTQKTPQHIKSHGAKHHSQPHGKHAASHHPDSEQLFKEVCPALHDASKILLVGPGEAKVHFKTYLEKHFAGTLGKLIVGVETVDHPTDSQIRDLAAKFFQIYNLYHSS